MTTQVMCEQCCEQVPECECVAAEDGRKLCLRCSPAVEGEDRALCRAPAEECCREAPRTDAVLLTPDGVAPLPPPEPCS
jgi:hypothetical protein